MIEKIKKLVLTIWKNKFMFAFVGSSTMVIIVVLGIILGLQVILVIMAGSYKNIEENFDIKDKDTTQYMTEIYSLRNDIKSDSNIEVGAAYIIATDFTDKGTPLFKSNMKVTILESNLSFIIDVDNEKTYDISCQDYMDFDSCNEKTKQILSNNYKEVEDIYNWLFVYKRFKDIEFYYPSSDILYPMNPPYIVTARFDVGNYVGDGRTHKGVDIVPLSYLDGDWTIFSVYDGVVSDIGTGCDQNGSLLNNCNGGRGNYVTIQHNYNNQIYYSRYYHLLDVSVEVGEEVTNKTIIGEGGHSGQSTGRHLHLEFVDRNGNRFDPLPLLIDREGS